MNKKYTYGSIMIFVILAGTILFHPKFVFAQSPTPTVTVALTQSLTPTPTSTPSPTPTSVPTLSYPSVNDIRKGLQSNFDELKSLINKNTKSEISTSVNNVRDNLIASLIWEVGIKLIIIGGISALLRLALRFWRRGDTSDNKTTNVVEKRVEQTLDTIIVVALVVLFALAIQYISSGANNFLFQTKNQSQISDISQKLDHIESQLNSLSNATSTPIPQPTQQILLPPSTANPVSQNSIDTRIPLVISLGIVVLFLVFASMISANQTKVYDISLSKINWDTVGRKLLPAGFLIFILYLLPEPVDTILLPILIPFFIFGFFDVVLLYPNHHLKNIVVKHYSLFIFLAIFGVWLRFFEVVQRYMYPLWDVVGGVLRSMVDEIVRNQQTFQRPTSITLLQFWNESPYLLVQFGWDLLPLLLALVFSIAPWRHIRKISKEKYIPQIKGSSK